MKLLILALCSCAAYASVLPPRTVGTRRGVLHREERAAPKSAYAPVQAVAKASVSTSDVDAPVLRSDVDVQPDGFAYAYETGNGIAASATGTLKRVDTIDALTVQGSYQYTAPDGTPVKLEYTADENGYQPQGDLLPVPPPVPVAIARALEYIAAHPPAEENPKYRV